MIVHVLQVNTSVPIVCMHVPHDTEIWYLLECNVFVLVTLPGVLYSWSCVVSLELYCFIDLEYRKYAPTDVVSVLPILSTRVTRGYENSVELKSFKIKVQDPAKNMIQMCIQVFSEEDLLPVFINFMLHYKGDKNPFKV